MNLEKFIPKKNIIILTSMEKQHALKELVTEIQNLGLIKNKDRYYAQIVHRESLENTGIGNMLAIPHARTESVQSFISVIGICQVPIDYQSLDNRPVKYIMLSIFPTIKSTKYLYFIGMMARIFNTKENEEFLQGTPSPDELFEFLNEQCKQYFNSLSKQGTFSDKKGELSGIPSSDLDLMIRLDRLYNLYYELNSPALMQKIQELKKLIDNRLLTYYERMIKKKNNPFAVVEKNNCTGCHMAIPPVNIKKIHDRDGIQVCTYCGRFLIML